MRILLGCLFSKRSVCLTRKHARWNQIEQATETPSSPIDPKRRQIPVAGGTKHISRCGNWQECHGIKAGVRGEWDFVGSRGPSGGGRGRSCSRETCSVHSGIAPSPCASHIPTECRGPFIDPLCVSSRCCEPLLAGLLCRFL